MNVKPVCNRVFLLLASFMLIACGGGGGSDNASSSTNNSYPDGLLAYYSFNETLGKYALNPIDNKLNGLITAASRVDGKYGDGLLFNFEDANLRPDTSLYFGNGLITIEAWIKPTRVEANATYRLIGDYSTTGLSFQIRDGKLEILFAGNSYLYGETEILPDTWTHIAFSSDGTNVIIYVNGIVDSFANVTLPVNSILNPLIGVYRSGPASYIEEFPGIIDELRIWNTARTAEEIIMNYDTEIIQTNSLEIEFWNSIVKYNFNETVGNIAFNSSADPSSFTPLNGNIYAASRVTGYNGNGLLFGNTDSNVTIDGIFYTSDGVMSVEAWINPSILDATGIYRIIGDYYNSRFYFQIRERKLEVLFNNQSYHYGSTEIQPGVWTHVKMVSDGKYVVTYINNIEEARTNITLPAHFFSQQRIGAGLIGASSTNEEFQGLIDELEIKSGDLVQN